MAIKRYRKITQLMFVFVFVHGCSFAHSNCSGVYELEDTGWYEKHMRAAGAVPLCNTRSVEEERYRFTWLRSFDNPIVVTVNKDGSKVEMTSVKLSGKGGYEPGTVIEKRRERLKEEDFEKIKSLIAAMNFWELPAIRERPSSNSSSEEGFIDEVVQLDGSQWIIEGATNTKSHAVDRWSDVEGPYRQFGLFMLEKSGLTVDGDIY